MTPLQQARDYLSDPDRWCQGHFAINEYLVPVDRKSPKAVACCIMGALFRFDADGHSVRQVLPDCWPTVATFNDHPNTTHDQVLELLDKAISYDCD